MIRLFVAVALPESVRLDLAALAGGIPGARWVEAQNMHVTLQFIGDIEEGLAHDIDLSLEAIEAPPFELRLEGIGYFGPARAARLVHVGVQRSNALNFLRDKIESAVVRAGLPPDERKFLPHVTLARLKDAPASRVVDFIADHNLFRAGPIAVDHFTLFSSFHGRTGPIYRPERIYPLGNPMLSADDPRLPEEDDVRG